MIKDRFLDSRGPCAHGRFPITSALVNCAGLALSMARLTRHELTADAIELVHATDLHTLPAEPPRLLRGAWIIESRRLERRQLFGDTASLGGYVLEGAVYLVGAGYLDGVAVAKWQPHWTGEDLDASVTPDTASWLIDDVDRHTAWARQAARFAVVFAVLLEAVSTPTTVDASSRSRQRNDGTPSAPLCGRCIKCTGRPTPSCAPWPATLAVLYIELWALAAKVGTGVT